MFVCWVRRLSNSSEHWTSSIDVRILDMACHIFIPLFASAGSNA